MPTGKIKKNRIPISLCHILGPFMRFRSLQSQHRRRKMSCCWGGYYDNGDARMRSMAKRTASATSLRMPSWDDIRSTLIVASAGPSTDILPKFCNRRTYARCTVMWHVHDEIGLQNSWFNTCYDCMHDLLDHTTHWDQTLHCQQQPKIFRTWYTK